MALLNGTQFSTAYALAGLFEADLAFRSAWSPARCPPTPHVGPMRLSTGASIACAATAGRSKSADALRELMRRQRHPGIAPRR